MPVAGSVLEVNETLESTPTLVNAKPYNEGWMLRIRMDDPAEAATLADSARLSQPFAQGLGASGERPFRQRPRKATGARAAPLRGMRHMYARGFFSLR